MTGTTGEVGNNLREEIGAMREQFEKLADQVQALELVEKKYLTREQVAVYLGTTPGTIAVWTSRRKIPHIKVGGKRKVLYPRVLVDEWLAQHLVPVER